MIAGRKFSTPTTSQKFKALFVKRHWVRGMSADPQRGEWTEFLP
jgi:hypothetical protein